MSLLKLCSKLIVFNNEVTIQIRITPNFLIYNIKFVFIFFNYITLHFCYTCTVYTVCLNFAREKEKNTQPTTTRDKTKLKQNKIHQIDK